jgi:hypothetical protein
MVEEGGGGGRSGNSSSIEVTLVRVIITIYE